MYRTTRMGGTSSAPQMRIVGIPSSVPPPLPDQTSFMRDGYSMAATPMIANITTPAQSNVMTDRTPMTKSTSDSSPTTKATMIPIYGVAYFSCTLDTNAATSPSRATSSITPAHA